MAGNAISYSQKKHFEEDAQGILKSSHLHNTQSICMFIVYTILPSATQTPQPYTWKTNKSTNTRMSHTVTVRPEHLSRTLRPIACYMVHRERRLSMPCGTGRTGMVAAWQGEVADCEPAKLPASGRRHRTASSTAEGEPAKLPASGIQRGTAGSAWPSAQTQQKGMMAPTTACGLPALLSGRQLARNMTRS